MDVVDTDKIDFKALGVPEHLISQAKAELEGTALAIQNELMGKVSPRGALNVSELLDTKRLDWLIPDAAIEAGRGCLFDHILVYQLPMLARKRGDRFDTHFGGGLLAKPSSSQQSDTRSAPRGVIVGAGLGALDSLRSHGVDIGHTVKFLKNTVYRIQVDKLPSKADWEYVSVCHIHDIVLSEELAGQLREGVAKVSTDANGQHIYTDAEGHQWKPVRPFDDESM